MGKKALSNFIEELGVWFSYEKQGNYIPWFSSEGRAQCADCLRYWGRGGGVGGQRKRIRVRLRVMLRVRVRVRLRVRLRRLFIVNP